MKPISKAFAIIASIAVIGFSLIYALTLVWPDVRTRTDVDETKTEALNPGDDLVIDTSISGVTVTMDAAATGVTAHLHGSLLLDREGQELEITRDGSTVTVRAGRNRWGILKIPGNMRLDIVVPAGFSGGFDCQSSAGAIDIQTDFAVKSFRAHSSAGAVKAQNVRATGRLEVSSSAGSVEAAALEATDIDMHTSAGRVRVESCKAATVRLQSSAGSVTAGALSGTLDISSSAGSVTATLADVAGSADISSSAGSVHVTLPSGASADIDAYTSAGRVSIDGLSLDPKTQKRNKVAGRLGDGGPVIKVHSSAGSVEIIGK